MCLRLFSSTMRIEQFYKRRVVMIVLYFLQVMEPTLMAVLAVSSLRKLELIGDHRQLPAFIQNCWFNLENQHRSIKTSLFERLLDQGKGRSVELDQSSDPRSRNRVNLEPNGACTVCRLCTCLCVQPGVSVWFEGVLVCACACGEVLSVSLTFCMCLGSGRTATYALNSG